MNTAELRKKYPGVTFYDKPRAGIYFYCHRCKCKAWIPTSKLDTFNERLAFPHYKCSAPDRHIRATTIATTTGSPYVTVWDEEPL